MPNKAWKSRAQNGTIYTFTDHIPICCKYETIKIDDRTDVILDMDKLTEILGEEPVKNTLTAPKNGILRRPG